MNDAAPLSPPDYERSDAAPRHVLLAALLVGALVAGAASMAYWMFAGWYLDGAPARPREERFFQHGPKDKTGVERDWAELDRQVAERLHGYGWIDHEAGVVRLPIEHAMELVAAEDAAARAKPEESR